MASIILSRVTKELTDPGFLAAITATVKLCEDRVQHALKNKRRQLNHKEETEKKLHKELERNTAELSTKCVLKGLPGDLTDLNADIT